MDPIIVAEAFLWLGCCMNIYWAHQSFKQFKELVKLSDECERLLKKIQRDFPGKIIVTYHQGEKK